MSEICSTCGLPTELCVCESIAKESQMIEVKIIKKKFGKQYTVISGIDQKEIDLNKLVKSLKSKFACGGTTKAGKIELQGNHKQRLRKVLIGLGFAAETIVIK
ncbi:translation initiation factor [Candidatus Woesearchaeota archaeon]|jgi:translation initiation factor 1|nr:translation initiation factor [Candidatus Woesearchaeota archaeon]MBT6520311.1 translation initiation factor [Candidatus Woesearchaeota archaeon]MBT7368264.1 translation initiation factor [Candidatus Woesearchaeota archaeon]